MEDLTNVHQNTCTNISKPGIKCGAGTCVNGTQCCQEANSNHVTCCAKGSCNSKTGHCSKPRKQKCPTMVEGYDGISENPCKKWKLTMVLLLFIILVLTFGFIVVGLKCKKLMLDV